MTDAEERFNLLYRWGGRFPVDDNTANRDSISQMGMAEHRPDVLYNAMRDLGCQVFDSNRSEVGCGGGDLFMHSHSIEPPDVPKKISWLTTPWDSGCRRFVTRVPVDAKPISKALQNLSAVALMLMGENNKRKEK